MSNIGLDYEDWQAAIVAGVDGGTARLVFASGKTGDLPRGNATMPVRGKGGTAFAALKPGDIIAVAPSGSAWSLRSIPAVSGGMIVEQPDPGRILAMQGGFDSRVPSFNRPTQAMRKPGSTIKPIDSSAEIGSAQ